MSLALITALAYGAHLGQWKGSFLFDTAITLGTTANVRKGSSMNVRSYFSGSFVHQSFCSLSSARYHTHGSTRSYSASPFTYFPEARVITRVAPD